MPPALHTRGAGASPPIEVGKHDHGDIHVHPDTFPNPDKDDTRAHVGKRGESVEIGQCGRVVE